MKFGLVEDVRVIQNFSRRAFGGIAIATIASLLTLGVGTADAKKRKSKIKKTEGRLVAFAEGPAPARRQDKPRLYARNGPAVLAVKRSVVLDQASLYGDDCRPLVMDAESSVDVDEPADLAYAEHLLERRGALPTESDRVVAGGLS